MTIAKESGFRTTFEGETVGVLFVCLVKNCNFISASKQACKQLDRSEAKNEYEKYGYGARESLNWFGEGFTERLRVYVISIIC
jgi:hypothetical protein